MAVRDLCRVRIELGNFLESGRPRPPRRAENGGRDDRPPINSQAHCGPFVTTRQKTVRDELENSSVPPVPSPAESRDEETIPPVRALAARKILKLVADPARSKALIRARLFSVASEDILHDVAF